MMQILYRYAVAMFRCGFGLFPWVMITVLPLRRGHVPGIVSGFALRLGICLSALRTGICSRK